MSAPAKPLPQIDAPNQPFWDGARLGKLVLQHCLDCGRQRFPATRYCPHCHGANSAWRQASGRGEVESYCTFHKAYWPAFASEVPYDVVQIRLDEGVRLFSNLVGVAHEQLRIGMRVIVHFEAVTPDIALVKFKPEP